MQENIWKKRIEYLLFIFYKGMKIACKRSFHKKNHHVLL